MNTPRRPLVPGPSNPGNVATADVDSGVPGVGSGGIAARAIAMREARGEQPGLVQIREAPTPSLLPIGPVGNMAGAIAAVMCNIGTIKKGGFNAYHKYHYARMEDLLEALTPLMGQNGLAYTQNEIEISKVEGNRVAVLYEFTMMHKSGEITRVRQSGMAIARDSKGNWDDKSIAKCHTNARKQYLLGLFNVPSGDFEDSDKDDRQQEQRPIPGPKQAEAKTTSREAAPVEQKGPHRIALGQGAGADQWAGAYIKAISTAKSEAEVKQWDQLNDDILQALSEKYPGVYDQVDAATTRHLANLGASPSVPTDPQEAMNWIASQLQGFASYEAAEAFWNQKVAPLEKQFDVTDWEMLMQEWRRAETRLGAVGAPE